MLFTESLQRGTLLRRYKRFLADVLLDERRDGGGALPEPGIDAERQHAGLGGVAVAQRQARAAP